MEIRGQLAKVGSFIPPGASWELNSDPPSWQLLITFSLLSVTVLFSVILAAWVMELAEV